MSFQVLRHFAYTLETNSSHRSSHWRTSERQREKEQESPNECANKFRVAQFNNTPSFIVRICVMSFRILCSPTKTTHAKADSVCSEEQLILLCQSCFCFSTSDIASLFCSWAGKLIILTLLNSGNRYKLTGFESTGWSD